MSRLPVFFLYRQRLPAAAPQSVQILSTCHALARAGADVTLVADPPLSSDVWRRLELSHCAAAASDVAPTAEQRMGTPAAAGKLDPAAVLAEYGLEPAPGLRLTWSTRRHRTLAGLEYRAALFRWLRMYGARQAVVFSRRVDYAAWLLRWRRRLGLSFGLCFEWHYLPSANALEAGETTRARALCADEAEVLSGADGHVVVSHALEAFLHRQGAPRGPVRVIPNGGPTPTRAPDGLIAAGAPGSTGRPARVVYAGLFRRAEDFTPLLHAFRHLPEPLELVILGGDEGGAKLDQVRLHAEGLGLAGRVRLTGPVSPVATRTVLAGADVAVATFADSVNMRHFACPLKILEYQAAGIPLISTDHPTVRELVDSGRNGLLVAPDDPEALAAGLKRLLVDRPFAAGLAARGLVDARERTWERRGERLMEFLLELAGSERRVRQARGRGGPA